MARGFRRDGITRAWFQQRGTAAMISTRQRRNGLTSLAGLISGHRRVAMSFTCRNKNCFAAAFVSDESSFGGDAETRSPRRPLPSCNFSEVSDAVLNEYAVHGKGTCLRYIGSVFVNAFRDRILVDPVVLSARAWKHLPHRVSDRR